MSADFTAEDLIDLLASGRKAENVAPPALSETASVRLRRCESSAGFSAAYLLTFCGQVSGVVACVDKNANDGRLPWRAFLLGDREIGAFASRSEARRQLVARVRRDRDLFAGRAL
jgi:hypothetical protein